MDEYDIRAKAAEISVNSASRLVSAIIIRDGIECLSEFDPLRLATDVEEYIRFGKIPKPIPVVKIKVNKL